MLKTLGNLDIRRDTLIEALHLVQDKEGYLSKDNIVALAEIFKLSMVEVYEVASFYHHFDLVEEGEKPPNKIKIRICNGLTCEIKKFKKFKRFNLQKFFQSISYTICSVHWKM